MVNEDSDRGSWIRKVKDTLGSIMSSLWGVEFGGSAEQQSRDGWTVTGKSVWHDQNYRLRRVTVCMLELDEITQEQSKSPSISLGKMDWGFSLLTSESRHYAYAKAMAPTGVSSQ